LLPHFLWGSAEENRRIWVMSSVRYVPSRWFLAWLIVWTENGGDIHPKRQLTLSGLRCLISQKIDTSLFFTEGLRESSSLGKDSELFVTEGIGALHYWRTQERALRRKDSENSSLLKDWENSSLLKDSDNSSVLKDSENGAWVPLRHEICGDAIRNWSQSSAMRSRGLAGWTVGTLYKVAFLKFVRSQWLYL
jgi:hypothetical protein